MYTLLCSWGCLLKKNFRASNRWTGGTSDFNFDYHMDTACCNRCNCWKLPGIRFWHLTWWQWAMKWMFGISPIQALTKKMSRRAKSMRTSWCISGLGSPFFSWRRRHWCWGGGRLQSKSEGVGIINSFRDVSGFPWDLMKKEGLEERRSRRQLIGSWNCIAGFLVMCFRISGYKINFFFLMAFRFFGMGKHWAMSRNFHEHPT